MQHFQKIASGLDIAPVREQLDAHPELWNQNDWRKTRPDSPHTGMTDIWVRYNDIERLDLGNPAKFNEEHVPVWYPAWDKLTALKPLVFELMARVYGEMLGGILITRIPPGATLAPHVDHGWHVEQYDKFYLSIESAPGANFFCRHDGVTEALCPEPGDIWLFDNRREHWVENTSDKERITVIICIRTQMYGRK
jgi:Aspartyl/Asparaginyl beta-hydroxylase